MKTFTQRIMCAGLIASASSTVQAHTKAWYADHEDEAKKVAEKCRAEERADYQFAGDARQDCQNAADATYFSVYEPTEPTFSSMGGSR